MKKGAIGRKSLFLQWFIFISLCVLVFGWETDFTYRSAMAETRTAEEKELEDTLLEQWGELDTKDLEEYFHSLSAFSNENLFKRVLAYVKGATFDYEDFGKTMLSLLFAKVAELLPSFACIAAITVVSGLLSALKSQSLVNATSETISLVTYAAVLIPLFGVLTECFSQTRSGVAEMHKQMQLVYPLLLTLMAASGSTATAAICRPAVAFFSSTIVTLIQNVVLPLTLTVIVFTISSHLTKELKISKFTAFFKSMNQWIIGVSVSVFGLFFTLQSVTAAHSDGVMRRALKYAIGNGVPIVGGFLSGGFDLAVAGSALLKNALGGVSVLLLLSVLFEPLILLFVTGLFLRLTAAIAQPFGESRVADFLGETADNLRYCTAAICFTAFLYFLTILMMLFAAEAMF